MNLDYFRKQLPKFESRRDEILSGHERIGDSLVKGTITIPISNGDVEKAKEELFRTAVFDLLI